MDRFLGSTSSSTQYSCELVLLAVTGCGVSRQEKMTHKKNLILMTVHLWRILLITVGWEEVYFSWINYIATFLGSKDSMFFLEVRSMCWG